MSGGSLFIDLESEGPLSAERSALRIHQSSHAPETMSTYRLFVGVLVKPKPTAVCALVHCETLDF